MHVAQSQTGKQGDVDRPIGKQPDKAKLFPHFRWLLSHVRWILPQVSNDFTGLSIRSRDFNCITPIWIALGGDIYLPQRKYQRLIKRKVVTKERQVQERESLSNSFIR